MSLINLKREVDEFHEDKTKHLGGDMVLSKFIEEFNNDLYKIVTCYEKGNFAMSGLSAYLALSMCAMGARESTAKEMYNALHLDRSSRLKDVTKIIAYLKNWDIITLNIANQMYADEKIIVKDAFKSDVKNIFHSAVKNLDFQSEIGKIVDDVNQWCSKQTNDKIKNILSSDDIQPTTRLILLNVIYFNAHWQEVFMAIFTQCRPFHVSQTETISVPTMKQCANLMYKDLPKLDAECIAKPYRDSNFLFVVIKPKEIDGLRYLEQNLDNINLDYRTFESCLVSLSLPKFRIETTLDLNKYLKKLGMVEMFTEQADFKGISDIPKLIPPLHVNKVLQKVFIEVNEKGTEAAAVTLSCLRGGGGEGEQPKIIPFQVDRPFLYRIVNVKYNLILFSGRVTLPECP